VYILYTWVMILAERVHVFRVYTIMP
jgi:hypothetical protein